LKIHKFNVSIQESGEKFTQSIFLQVLKGVNVNQSRYRTEVAQRVPGS